jgi:hypothetical protein
MTIVIIILIFIFYFIPTILCLINCKNNLKDPLIDSETISMLVFLSFIPIANFTISFILVGKTLIHKFRK